MKNEKGIVIFTQNFNQTMRQMSLFTPCYSFISRCSMLAFILFGANQIFGQASISEQNVTVLTNASTIIDTISSLEEPLVYNQVVDGFGITTLPLGNNEYAVKVEGFENGIPTPIGRKSVAIKLITQLVPVVKFSIQVYNIDFVYSIVKANTDVVIHTGDDMTILPLGNDVTSASSITLHSINQTLYGTATINGSSIQYANNNFDGFDYILYTIVDDSGSDAQGLVYIMDEDYTFTSNQSFTFALANNSQKSIVLPNGDFSLTSGPLHGTLNEIGGYYQYDPADNFVGQDSFVFGNTGGFSFTYHAVVISAVKDGGIVKDDKVYTPKSTSIAFNPLSNDLASSYPVTSHSPELTRDSAGIFHYTPPSNFEGVKNFYYKVKYGYTTETGKIAMNVGNFKPASEVILYHFNVLKNHDFILNYDVPIEGYSFTMLSNPDYGIAEIYTDTTIQLVCGEVSGKSFIRYTPGPGYTGRDTFEVRYCINGGQCKNYKLAFEVFDTDATACNCVQSCVWSGDANGDGRVSITDIMPIGRYMGRVGPNRDEQDFGVWTGQQSNNWVTKQSNGRNIKHADTNGDGVITAEDAAAVVTNYGKLDNLVSNEVLGVKDFPFTMIPDHSPVDSGDLLTIYIKLGNDDVYVNDAFGLSYSLSIPTSLYDSSSLSMVYYDNSWFTDLSPGIGLTLQPVDGQIYTGFSRTNDAVSGQGIIAELSFIVEEEVDGFKTNEKIQQITRNLFLDNAILEDEEGNKFALPSTSVPITINLTSSENQVLEDKLVVLPNPVSDQLRLHFNGKNIINEVQIFDMMGRIVHNTIDVNSQSLDINTSTWVDGMYMLQVSTNKGVVTKKVVVDHVKQ